MGRARLAARVQADQAVYQYRNTFGTHERTLQHVRGEKKLGGWARVGGAAPQGGQRAAGLPGTAERGAGSRRRTDGGASAPPVVLPLYRGVEPGPLFSRGGPAAQAMRARLPRAAARGAAVGRARGHQAGLHSVGAAVSVSVAIAIAVGVGGGRAYEVVDRRGHCGGGAVGGLQLQNVALDGGGNDLKGQDGEGLRREGIWRQEGCEYERTPALDGGGDDASSFGSTPAAALVAARGGHRHRATKGRADSHLGRADHQQTNADY